MGKAFQGWGLNEKHEGNIFFINQNRREEKRFLSHLYKLKDCLKR